MATEHCRLNDASIVGAGAAARQSVTRLPNDRVERCVDANLVWRFHSSISGVTISGGGHETNGVGGGGIIPAALVTSRTITDCIVTGQRPHPEADRPAGGGIGNGAGTLNVSGTTLKQYCLQQVARASITDSFGVGSFSLSTRHGSSGNSTVANGNGGGAVGEVGPPGASLAPVRSPAIHAKTAPEQSVVDSSGGGQRRDRQPLSSFSANTAGGSR